MEVKKYSYIYTLNHIIALNTKSDDQIEKALKDFPIEILGAYRNIADDEGYKRISTIAKECIMMQPDVPTISVIDEELAAGVDTLFESYMRFYKIFKSTDYLKRLSMSDLVSLEIEVIINCANDAKLEKSILSEISIEKERKLKKALPLIDDLNDSLAKKYQIKKV